MKRQPILTGFVSEIDQLLQQFDKTHPTKSIAQRKEIDKYKRIYALRDSDQPQDESTVIWENF